MSRGFGVDRDMPSAKRPSWIPVIASGVACILSLTIYFVGPLQNSILVYLGYLLTPFTPILMMAISQTKHTAASADIYYDLATGGKILKISRILSIAGFLIAIPVIWVISGNFSQK